MTMKNIADVANDTTPRNVTVPETPQALIVWAIGQYGPTVAYLVVTLYMLVSVYADLARMNERIIAAFVQQAEANLKMAAAMSDLSKAMQQNTDEIRAMRRQP